MVQDWLARWKNNPTLVSDMAMYLLATLLSLGLRGVVLCDVGPTNAMVRSLDPYARVVFGDVAGWSLHKKPRHRGVGGFVNIFRGSPPVQAEVERILTAAKQTSLQAAFKLAANNCELGRGCRVSFSSESINKAAVSVSRWSESELLLWVSFSLE